MEKQSQMSRVAFARQPARILLVDFSLPFSAEMCYDLHQALEHTLAVACNMTGPARIPFFGLFALGVHSENLFPLQHVRGNFSRLQNALHELKTFAISQHTNLPQALQDAVLQFKRQSQTLRQTTSFSCQLEVIIITCKQGGMVSRQLDQMLSQMDLESIRKILVVSLASVCDSPVSSNASSENLTGILDVTTIEPGELSFQSFFTGWFHDCGTDREQLHLLFPNGVMSSDKLVLKCDLQERFIDPSLLPFNTQFMTCGTPNKPATSNQSAVSQQQATPVIKLRVMQMVKLKGICDSLMFGQPMVVRPTACWKLDWEELDSNQQNFHALCHHLHHREMCLVTRLEPSESTVYPSSSSTVPKPRGHFIILPSPSMSLLIKPIAVNELMLPGDYQIPAEKPISDSLQLVAQYLDQLEVLDAYNPLMNHCNLTSSLVGLMNKTSTRQPRKTKQQATVPVQPAFGGRGRGRRRGSTRPHQFQPASHLLNQPLQKKFCGLPMETDNCDFDL